MMHYRYVRIQGQELAENTMYAKGIFRNIQPACNVFYPAVADGNHIQVGMAGEILHRRFPWGMQRPPQRLRRSPAAAPHGKHAVARLRHRRTETPCQTP